MSEKERISDQLLLLVGSNPLPNYLAAQILKPKGIQLLYTPETEEVKNRLKKLLQQKHPQVEIAINEHCIADSNDARKVQDAFPSSSKNVHLHYTGGTKIMAAHARLAFRDSGGEDQQASYLDERAGVLRFDDGYAIDLSGENISLTVDDILNLHGIVRIGKEKKVEPVPNDQDAENLSQRVIAAPDLAERLYDIHRKEGKRASLQNAKAKAINVQTEFSLFLSICSIPGENWTENTYRKWCEFFGGEWLDVWTGSLMKRVYPDNQDNVSVDVNCKRDNGRGFQIDVALLRGHRLYVISCTTHTKIGLCKSKLFEVAMRARQLGGDLARSGLVSLLHGRDNQGPYIDQLRNDIADSWDAPNTPQVFGLDELREWAGIGCRSSTQSLELWLES
jgi:hypothetical protein